MAEQLSKDEAQNYPLSNGTTANLVTLAYGVMHSNWRTPVLEELAVGQVAYVSAMGKMRQGVVTKLGRTKVYVTFTTPGAISATYGGIRVQTTAAAANEIRVAPLAIPEPLAVGTVVAIEGGQVTIDDPERGQVTVQTGWTPTERDADLDEIVATEEQNVAEWRNQVEELDRLDAELETPEETAEREAEEDERDLPEAPMPVFIEPTEEPAPAAPLDPVTGSAIVAVLEETWEAIRATHPELPHVVIVTGSGFVGAPRWAHWRESGWQERADAEAIDHSVSRHGEMFVAGETLTKGAAHTVESMLHEGAHALATVREVQDTSRQGRWHNGEFRKLAEELGLAYHPEKADKTHGFSNMLLTPETRTKYADLIERLDKAIRATINMPAYVGDGEDGQAGGEFIHGGRRPKAEGSGNSTNNLKLTCACEKPRIIRASKKVAEEGQLYCRMCDDYFEVRD